GSRSGSLWRSGWLSHRYDRPWEREWKRAMDPERLDQLQNPDPAVRRGAIIALGRSKDLAALPELAKVYKNDPVPELRELARQAGRYIQQENRPAPEPPSPPPDFEPEPASDDTPTPVTPVATTPTPPPAITEADVRRGQSHYRAARNLHEAGEQARADRMSVE